MALTPVTAHWKLDESSGNATDSSSNGYTLTNSNVTYGPAKLNNGAVFNGSAYMTTGGDPSLLKITGALSISLYVKTSSTAIMHLVEKDDESGNNRRGYNVTMASGQIQFSVGNNSGYPTIATTTAINDNTLKHIVCVYIPSTSMTIFVNDIQVAQMTAGVPSAIYNNTRPFNVGYRNNGYGPDRYFVGTLDEISVLAFDFTADEVSQLFNSNRANAFPFTAIDITSINNKDANNYLGNTSNGYGTSDNWLHDHYQGVSRLFYNFTIPTGVASSSITSAFLNINYFQQDNGSHAGKTLNVYKCTRNDWIEPTGNPATGDLCWANYKLNTAWTTAGGDYVTSSPNGGSLTFADNSFGFKSIDITDIVKDAIDNNSRVCNIIVKWADETVTNVTTRSFSHFYSKEATNTTTRPYIAIEVGASAPTLHPAFLLNFV